MRPLTSSPSIILRQKKPENRTITESAGFHARGRVDGIAEEAVARHFQADDTGAHGPRVDADAQHQRLVRPVPDAELGDGAQQRQRHGGDLGRVLVSISDGQSADLIPTRRNGERTKIKILTSRSRLSGRSVPFLGRRTT